MQRYTCPWTFATLLALLTLPTPPSLGAATNELRVIDPAGVTGFTALVIPPDGRPVIAYQAGVSGLRVARCPDPTCFLTATITTVDATPHAGAYAAIAVGADGRPVLRYLRSDSTVQVLHCGNLACSDGNTITPLGSGDLWEGWGGIAIAADGLPVITFMASNRDLVVAKCNVANCASFATTVIDQGGYAAIAQGPGGTPILSYLSDLDVNDFVRCGTTGCTSGNTFGSVFSQWGWAGYRAIVRSTSGNPVISVYHNWDPDPNTVAIAGCIDFNCSAISGDGFPQGVDTGGTNDPGPAPLAIGSDGHPIVVYWQDAAGDLKLARCRNSLCSTGVEPPVVVDGVGNVGRHSSLAVGHDGLPIMSYLDATNGALKVAHCGTVGCNEVHVGAFEDGGFGGWSVVVP